MKKILISQVAPCKETSSYCNLFKQSEIKLDFCPFIEVKQMPICEIRKQKIDFSEFTSLIFTSKGAIDHYFKIAEEMRFKVPDSMKYFCQVEAIANYLQKYIIYRKRKIYVGQKNFVDLIPFFEKQSKDEKYLLPSSNILKEDIYLTLNNLNLNWKKAILFNTVGKDLSHLDISSYYLLVFFTPLEIKTFIKNFTKQKIKEKKFKIAVFGNSTYNEAKKAGLNIEIKVPSEQIPSMSKALEKYLEEKKILKKEMINT